MKRWAKRVGLALVALVGLVLWSVVAVFVYLQTDAGGARIRDELVAKANETISGSVRLGEVELIGATLVLRDLVLLDPDGDEVARFDELRVRVALLPLVKKTVRVEEIALTRPELHVVQSEAGTNLQAALAPRHPKPEAPPNEGDGTLPVDVIVEALSIANGRVSFEQTQGTQPLTVTLIDLDSTGALALTDRGEALAAEVSLNGAMTEPAETPVSLSVKATGAGDTRTVEAELKAGDGRAIARAKLEGNEELTVDLERLELPPSLVRAFAASWPLLKTLHATAHVEKRGADVQGRAHLAAGAATVDANGQVNVETLVSDGVKVVAEGIDLSELIEAGPKSAIAFTLEGKGGAPGRSLESLTGTLAVRAPVSKISGAQFGPIRIDASADEGRLRLQTFDAQVPGVAITARGEGDRERLHVFGRMAAKDLGLFAQTLGKLAGPKGLPLTGNGAVAFDLQGPMKGPAVDLTGRFPALAYAGNRVRSLELRAKVPNVKAPLAGDAEVQVSAARVVASGSGKTLICPQLSVTSKSGRLTVDASTRGFASIDLKAKGTIDDDRQGLTLSALTLRYPEAKWRLEKPARLRLSPGALAVQDLALRSGKQRFALDAAKSKTKVNAALHIAALRLERLPRAFVDPELRLKGVLGVDAKVSGRPQKPDVVAKVVLQNGRVKQYDGLSLALDGSWKDHRAAGKLDARAIGVRAHGTFDVPVDALKTAGPGQVRAHVVIEDAEIERLLAQLGRKELALRGTVNATLDLSGTARAPRLVAELHGRQLVIDGQAPMEVDVAAKSAANGKLVARVDATTQERSSFVAIETPWTLSRLIRRPPTAEQALHAALVLTGKFDAFPIPLATQLGPTPAVLDGEVELHGTALAPAGHAELTLRNVQPNVAQPPVTASVKLALTPKRTRAQLQVEQRDTTLVRADATLNAAFASLRSPRALETAPFEIDAAWGPLNLMELQELRPPSPSPERTKRPLLTGIVQGKLRASGTAADPVVNLEATVHGLGSAASAALGDVALRYAYRDARNTFSADLLSSGRGGTLTLTANTPLDLSLPALKRGVAWRRAPIEAQLEAHHFDPSFLSSVSPTLLQLAGDIEAKVAVAGSLSLPHVRGTLEWKDGALVLAGYGAYEQVHVRMHGDERRVIIEDASAHAGRGTVQATATLERAGDAVNLDVQAKLKEFPLVTHDQLAATVSLEASAKGTASLGLIDFPQVRIPEAHIELPASQKDVAQLEAPEDVVFLVNGEPIAKEAPEEGIGGAGAAGSANGPPTRELRAVIDAPRNLWVKGRDLNVEVGLSENFRVQMVEEPMLFGEVKVIRGQLEVVGRRFDFDPASTIAFTGPPTAPTLNVVAIHENRREDVTVTVRVTGSPSELEIHPTSEPPLSETEIYTLLVTGRRSLQPGGGTTTASNPATSLIGSLAAAQLKKGIEAVIPLEVLNIKAGERGIGGTRVEAGTYLSDRLFLGIQSTLGAQRDQRENQNEIRVEYQLWKRFLLELTYGDANKGTGDLIWRKQY